MTGDTHPFADPARQTGQPQPVIPAHPTRDFSRFHRADTEQAISDRFEQVVRRFPNTIAVKTTRDSWSYERLNARANQIAHGLLATRGSGNEPVALLFDQSTLLIAAIIGSLKAGKIYVPLDPLDPTHRNAHVLADSTAAVIVTDSSHVTRARELAAPHVSVLNAETAEGDHSTENPSARLGPDCLAYLFYTSGSTGKPKGLADTNRNVLHNIMRYTNNLHICPADRLTLLQSASFSGSVSSLFCALLNGATSFPFSLHHEGSDRLASWLSQEQLTIYHSVPSIFRLVATGKHAYPALRIVRLEGDQANPRDIELFKAYFPDTCVLVNGLGATECGIVRQYFVRKDTPTPESVVPIGFAVEDMEILLLDETGQVVGPDAVGEIAVRSRYLAPGYWRRPDLTDAAFLPDPQDGSTRVYRTGDLGRMRRDGCLEYLGRKNFQVKVRGQWVALAEIEAALLRLAAVKETAVVALEGASGERRLVAYLVPASQDAPTVSDLRQALSQTLPSHMVPGTYVMLEALPRTATGKLDRTALPDPGRDRPNLCTPIVPPRTPAEAAVCAIWADVLELNAVGIHDNLFDLGGDSLSATRVISRIRDALRIELSVRMLFDRPTVATLVEFIESAREGPGAKGLVERDGRSRDDESVT